MRHEVGIMQGRLSPPVRGAIQAFPQDTWADEFRLLSKVGLDYVEWIYDCGHGAENPLESVTGVNQINTVAAEARTRVRAICADWFMERPIVRVSPELRTERIHHLLWLSQRARDLGVEWMVLPFVDNSSLDTSTDIVDAANALAGVVDHLRATKVRIHLETNLAPAEYATFLSELPSDVFGVNYDSGNSAALGFDVHEEFRAYGERVGSVHIKDRLRGGNTVPLGRGDVAFESVFGELLRLDYNGAFTLQVARGNDGSELEWARTNTAFVRRYLETVV